MGNVHRAANANLHKVKDANNDEFYTQLTDVLKEMMHYKAHFKDKVVLCNCDDPMTLRKYRVTTSFLGVRVAGLWMIICRCFVRNVIMIRAISK